MLSNPWMLRCNTRLHHITDPANVLSVSMPMCKHVFCVTAAVQTSFTYHCQVTYTNLKIIMPSLALSRNGTSFKGNFNLILLTESGTPLLKEKLMTIKNPILKQKASSLPNLLESGYAKSTLRKYKPAWEKWVTWASQFEEISICPAEPLFIAIYINDLTNSFSKKSALTAAILGIR